MNKITTFLKRYKKTSIFFGILFVFYLGYAMPFKATDPNSPLFIESLFRLRDYGRGAGVVELRDKVLPKLFPVGTSKEYVDLMLVDRGGADILDKTHFAVGMYTYTYKPLFLMLTPDAFNIKIFYNQTYKVNGIHFGGKMIVGKNFKAQLSSGEKK
jgi:hypothetical protein